MSLSISISSCSPVLQVFRHGGGDYESSCQRLKSRWRRGTSYTSWGKKHKSLSPIQSNYQLTQLPCRSVRTYQNNGNQNGAPAASYLNNPTINDLYNQDITTPGYIRIPVCGPNEAYQNWYNVQTGNGNATYANYPCNP